MSTPVVVQGTAVPPANNYGGATATETPQGQEEEEPSKTGCKDPIFAVLFYLNIIAIVVVFITYGNNESNSETPFNYDNYEQYVSDAAVIGVASLIFSGLGLLFLIQYPSFMIKCGLIFSLLVSLAWTVYLFWLKQYIMGVLTAVFFLLTLCYTRAVWPRIPFAAINMVTAGTAIKANLGVIIFAIFFTVLQLLWLVLWSVASMGVLSSTYVCDTNNVCNPNYGYLFLMFLSLFFTQQVLQACVHVTVAGTVGTWWVAPDESGFCSRGICNSFIRTVTTSFGSICFGSLLVAIIQALRALANSARANGDGNFLVCIAECILACLASMLEYFNKWAYIYVGIYGYSYIESGKGVMQLFADRGWDAVIADDLVGNAIFLTAVVAGVVVGAVAGAYASINPSYSGLAEDSLLIAFFVGLVTGLCICLVLLSTIASGVNTVIVMFADAPQEFASNHPELSQTMTETWEQFFPGTTAQ
mmetsp:Transcript_28478/g.31959  ORF Transcript_28478/g.31959 Transcript_28478/m.31959 type:complete len:473 (+) Transcript_28478:140-1558(+)